MPNGKKQKSLATATRPRRGMGRKVGERPRTASLMELQCNSIGRTDLPATPKIQVPLNGYVPPGVDLQVVVGTNRMDLRYKLELRDLTDATVAPSVINIPAPMPANNFTGIFPARCYASTAIIESACGSIHWMEGLRPIVTMSYTSRPA